MRHPIRTHLRAVAAITGSVLAIVASGGTASASPPLTIRTEVHRLDPLAPLISAACGFPVIGVIDTTETAIAVRNNTGEVFHELNLSHGTETVSAPSTGKSFSFPVSGSYHYDYPQGDDIGDPVIVTLIGLQLKVPGAHANAGRIVYGQGVIVAVDPSGFPRVDFGDPTDVTPNQVDLSDAAAAICAALA